jgi:RNA polymerase sigma-70 factor, ECF subfamily
MNVLELVEPPRIDHLPDDEILRRERWLEVERSLDRLSPKLKIVVTLRFSAGLSYEEIADVLGIHLGTVKSRLFNGIKKLREDLSS